LIAKRQVGFGKARCALPGRNFAAQTGCTFLELFSNLGRLPCAETARRRMLAQ
jgi:hypothetical protein